MLDNIQSAFSSIVSNKLRSLLTVLGVIIGVSSVTVLIALGQGLKKDVSGLIQGFGTNVIAVVAGKIDTSSSAQINPANFISGDILTPADVTTISQNKDVVAVAPISLVSGSLKNGTKTSSETVFGSTPSILDSLQVLSLDHGQMFIKDVADPVIVLSSSSSQALFGSAEAVGQNISLGQTSFRVIGVLKKSKLSSSFSSELNNVSIIPYAEAKVLNKDQDKIVRIVAKASDLADVKSVKSALQKAILSNHKGEDDFSVLTQDDILGLFNQFLNLATAMVSAIAAISLLVGGIGIMNIMLVTVTERTREIGLRKALGATRGAILLQFLVEAVIVTLVGGMIGLLVSYGAGQLIALKTPLKPEFSWQVVGVTVGISLVIGIVFGLWPALRAANKDPIEALRYE